MLLKKCSIRGVPCAQQHRRGLPATHQRAQHGHKSCPRLVALSAAAPSIAAVPAAASSPSPQAREGALTTSGIVYHDPQWNSVESEEQFFAILEVKHTHRAEECVCALLAGLGVVLMPAPSSQGICSFHASEPPRIIMLHPPSTLQAHARGCMRSVPQR